MSSSRSSRQEGSVPLVLVETNAGRNRRPVFLKHRPLSGFFKSALSSGNEEISHWALQIGPYTHELRAAEGGSFTHFRGRWTVAPELEEQIGTTDYTDEEIDSKAERVIQGMASQGSYRVATNNCQLFCKKLSHQIIRHRSENRIHSHMDAGTVFAVTKNVASYGLEALRQALAGKEVDPGYTKRAVEKFTIDMMQSSGIQGLESFANNSRDSPQAYGYLT